MRSPPATSGLSLTTSGCAVVPLRRSRVGNPDYSAVELRHARFRLLLGDDLFHRAWPDAPLRPP